MSETGPGHHGITNPARAKREELIEAFRALTEENERLRGMLGDGGRIPAAVCGDLLDEEASAAVARWVEAVEALAPMTLERFRRHAESELQVAARLESECIPVSQALERYQRAGGRPDLGTYLRLWEHVCALYPVDGAGVDRELQLIRVPRRRLQSVLHHVEAYERCTRIPRGTQSDREDLLRRVGEALVG